MLSKSQYFLFSFSLIFLLTACSKEEALIPKPRIYPRVQFPERTFSAFELSSCDFEFKRPDHTRIERDTAFFDGAPVHSCWFDLFYPNFDARLHFSYYPVDKFNSFEKLRQDAFVLAQKHNAKANYIDEIPLEKNERVKGMIFQLEGEVASPVQFYLTDERSNFLRASLYFNTKSRPDSLAPIVDFIKEDISQLVQTFEWTN
ncbi:MAG: hypothetical protein HKN16_13155 [Saprospiraceae bacterium]|nr:hypothetical protein [Saprospiraceae bacterium]